jgi:hypothetical protein
MHKISGKNHSDDDDANDVVDAKGLDNDDVPPLRSTAR